MDGPRGDAKWSLQDVDASLRFEFRSEAAAERERDGVVTPLFGQAGLAVGRTAELFRAPR